MTPEEADKAYDEADPVPMTDAEIEERVAGVMKTERKQLKLENDRLVKILNDVVAAFAFATERRLKEMDEFEKQAKFWHDRDDDYGWNFHKGIASGMVHASLIYDGIVRELKKAMKEIG